MSLSLDADQLDRYSRHVIMDEVGPEGKKAPPRRTRARVVGAGGLGAPVIQYLAAAGVGTIRIVDGDVVERSNLQRQVIHGDADVGEPKVESAARYVDRLNPDIDVETYETRLDEGNVRDLLAGYDLVVDCADNFRTRYVVNDAARIEGLPVVHGAIYKFEGQATTLVPDGPCYRCLFPEAPEPGTVPDCATTGVLGVLPGTVGCIQTTEAIKLLLDTGETLDGRVLFYDAMDMTFESVPYRRNPDCPVCGDDGIETIEGSTTRAGVASTRTDSQRPVRHRRPRGPVGPVVDEAGADAPAAVLVARPVRRAAVPTDDRLAVGVERGGSPVGSDSPAFTVKSVAPSRGGSGGLGLAVGPTVAVPL